MKTYSGRGFDQIVSYIDANTPNGILSGKVIRNTGEKIADVSFEISNDTLVLTVGNEEFSNVTAAVRKLAENLNTPSGSNEDGNSANGVIGNYAITKHFLFGNTSLEQIIGKSTKTVHRISKNSSRNTFSSVKVVRLLNSVARVGIFTKYSYQIVRAISDHFNFNSKYMAKLLDTLTTSEFELMFGRAENNFDLNVYKA